MDKRVSQAIPVGNAECRLAYGPTGLWAWSVGGKGVTIPPIFLWLNYLLENICKFMAMISSRTWPPLVFFFLGWWTVRHGLSPPTINEHNRLNLKPPIASIVVGHILVTPGSLAGVQFTVSQKCACLNEWVLCLLVGKLGGIFWQCLKHYVSDFGLWAGYFFLQFS